MRQCIECNGTGILAGGQWLRPGALAEARILGRWPTQAVSAIWSDGVWQMAETGLPETLWQMAEELVKLNVKPRIGLDVAVFGDDFTDFHCRLGGVSLEHVTYNGRDTDHTIGQAVVLADKWASWATAIRKHGEPWTRKDITFTVDPGGIGGDLHVRMRAQKLHGIPCGAGTPAQNPNEYPNRRSELWFQAVKRAAAGNLHLGLIPVDMRRTLKAQAMAPTWRLNASGQMEVEPKDYTKQKLGRSPDGLDALNLAYFEGIGFTPPAPVENPQRKLSGDHRHDPFRR
jgi:hypothetical protein